jgi:hypothetical protein
MPPDELKQVGGPKGRHHYNIPERVRASLVLQNFQACILPEHISSFYVIYFGEAANLKARAREHISGHDETGCLALGNYSKLHRYKWYFSFSLLPFEKRLKKDKLVRVVGEQLWRAKHGWPILCAE